MKQYVAGKGDKGINGLFIPLSPQNAEGMKGDKRDNPRLSPPLINKGFRSPAETGDNPLKGLSPFRIADWSVAQFRDGVTQ